MKRCFGALLAVLAVCSLLSGATKAAMIINVPYWDSGTYQNDLMEVPAKHTQKACTYISAPVTGSASPRDVCAVSAAWGQITDDGYIRYNGQGTFVRPHLPAGMTLLPVAQTERVYVKIPTGQVGLFKVGYFEHGSDVRLDFVPPEGQPIILGYEQAIYYDELGQTIATHHDFEWSNVSFSANGEWMVGAVSRASGSGYCMGATSADRWCDFSDYTNFYARMRLNDQATGGFGTTEGKQVSGLTLSITNDGEAATVTGYNYWKVDLYNFPYGAPLDMNELRVRSDAPQTLGDQELGGRYASNAFFSDDNKYLYYNVRHDNRTDLMRLWPGGAQTAHIDSYLALGDSFSSGEGLYDYRPETDFYHSDSDHDMCHQSPESYGYLLNAVINPDRFGSVTCSGAFMKDIVFTNPDSRKTYWDDGKPQARGINISTNQNDANSQRILKHFLPGYVDQNTVVNDAKPSVATISVGGNDAAFTYIVTACVLNKYPLSPLYGGHGGWISDTCYDNRDEREELANSLDGNIDGLTETFKAVRASMSGDQRLYVVGYPQAISWADTLRCDIGTPIYQNERLFLVNFTNYLNESIRAAATNAGAVFVDTSGAFVDGNKDYRLCGNQGESAMNDIEYNSKSTRKPGDSVNQESFHPTLLGHILMTRQIRQQTQDLTSPMSDPLPESDWITSVNSYYREQLVGDTDNKTGGKKAEPVENIAPNTIYKSNTKTPLHIVQHDAVQGDVYAVLFSDPTQLGQLQVDADGVISGNVVIPDSVPTGYHQLHIMYTTASGEQKDIYQYVFVGEKPGDLNGNGVDDSQEQCLFAAVPGLDMNGDGVANDCIFGNALQDAAQSPGNNLDTLIASGAVTLAEADMVRKASGTNGVSVAIANSGNLGSSTMSPLANNQAASAAAQRTGNNLGAVPKTRAHIARWIWLGGGAVVACFSAAGVTLAVRKFRR